MIGIYQITNRYNDRKYIGKSSNLMNRWNTHLLYLMNGTHNNKYLQNDFVKHGYVGFTFEILEICELNELDKFENEYISALGDDDYNINGKLVDSTPSVRTNVLVYEIEDFISKKFCIGIQIDINIIKHTFKLSRRQWDTIRTKLNNVEVKGKKTYRIA